MLGRDASGDDDFDATEGAVLIRDRVAPGLHGLETVRRPRAARHMLTDAGDHPSTTVAGLEDNTLADGLFHLATWFFIVTAMLLTVRAWQRGELAPPWRVHFGMLLAGWGAFNVVEGVIDHQLLGIHHVRDDLGAPLGWDLAFLAFGVLLIVAGAALARTGEGLARRTRRHRSSHRGR
jgi:uncharacterized membrane protein